MPATERCPGSPSAWLTGASAGRRRKRLGSGMRLMTRCLAFFTVLLVTVNGSSGFALNHHAGTPLLYDSQGRVRTRQSYATSSASPAANHLDRKISLMRHSVMRVRSPRPCFFTLSWRSSMMKVSANSILRPVLSVRNWRMRWRVTRSWRVSPRSFLKLAKSAYVSPEGSSPEGSTLGREDWVC